MDRSRWRRRRSGPAYAGLMRSLLFPQSPTISPRGGPAAIPRLLALVVPGIEEFIQRLAPENWTCTSRALPLSVPFQYVPASQQCRGVPNIGSTSRSALPRRRTGHVCCIALRRFRPRMMASRWSLPILPPDSGNCGNLRILVPTDSGINGSGEGQRALFHTFSATRHPDFAAKSGVAYAYDELPASNGRKCMNDPYSRVFRQPDSLVRALWRSIAA